MGLENPDFTEALSILMTMLTPTVLFHSLILTGCISLLLLTIRSNFAGVLSSSWGWSFFTS